MEMHDEALDELAKATLDGDGGFEVDEEVDDFDALMAGLDDGASAGGSVNGGPSKRVAPGGSIDEEDEEEDGPTLGDPDDDSGEDDEEDGEDDSEPSSFSRIPTAILHKYLGLPTTAVAPTNISASDFPNLKKTCKPFVVHLKAGEMLYLPASWWHEVTSTSTTDSDIHMAFNYWFYPPTSQSYQEPYEDKMVWSYFRQKVASDAGVLDGAKRKRDDSDLAAPKKVKR